MNFYFWMAEREERVCLYLFLWDGLVVGELTLATGLANIKQIIEV